MTVPSGELRRRGRMPVIGVAPSRLRDASGGGGIGARPRYGQSLLVAGALPVVLAQIEPGLAREFVSALDGIVLPGGRDIPPAHYGEAPTPELEEVLEEDLARTYLEIARAALELDVPILGICLGMQVMNVALGGSLRQHLRAAPGAPLHRGEGEVDIAHPVSLRPGSRLRAALGRDHAEVVSHHHQGVKLLAPGLEPTAWAADGLIEAFEQPGRRFFLGVQWHPERSGEAGSSLRLFEALVAEARRGAVDRPSGSS